MSLSDLASLGSFVSGVAVLVSLIFVAVQLRQNTEAVRAAAFQAHEAELHEVIKPIIEHDEIAELYRVGLAGLATLNANQRVRFLVLLHGMTRYYQASWMRWQLARLDTGHWHTVERNFRSLAEQAGFQEFWNLRRNWFWPEFVAWFEALPKKTAERGLYDLPNT